MRTARLFSLLDLLRGKSLPVSAENLARDLGVSTRTIYRDIATLEGLGAPVRGEAGVGYLLERGAFLPPMRFDGDELDALVMGLQLAGRLGDPVLSGGALRALAKLRASLPEDDARNLLARRIRPVAGHPRLAESDRERFALLRSAIAERQLLDLVYCKAGGDSAARRVRPLGLFAFGSTWLLTAWCELRGDFRHFRLDRIGDLASVGGRFRPERGKRLEDALARIGQS